MVADVLLSRKDILTPEGRLNITAVEHYFATIFEQPSHDDQKIITDIQPTVNALTPLEATMSPMQKTVLEIHTPDPEGMNHTTTYRTTMVIYKKF